ncbi:hypothetical protein ACH5RR_006451 [Cinchona calisaya]|uniref:Uncharacterized protein n=1 Tax=Cinchona calisaya TaxID=153742 RepID=A0ABD3AP31_9GENT
MPALPAHSPSTSPVPYLYRGLGAMLGLIAFALIVLVCSYCKPNEERNLEAGDQDGSGDCNRNKTPPVPEESFLVIMPGQERPTCLATKTSSSASGTVAD